METNENRPAENAFTDGAPAKPDAATDAAPAEPGAFADGTPAAPTTSTDAAPAEPGTATAPKLTAAEEAAKAALLKLPTDRRIAQLATRQRGVVTREQLLELQVTAQQIRGRIARGSLHPLAPSVFAVGHTGLGRRGLANAALLQAKLGRAAISHESAARAWEIVAASAEGPIHVSVTDRRKLEVPAGTVLHRPRNLTEDDIVWHRGVPVTTPERTVRDLLAGSSVSEVTRMLEQMVTVLGRSPDDLHDWGSTLTGIKYHGKLAEALDHVVGPAVLRSELEARFRDLCQEAHLPLPTTNQKVGPWEVDALWWQHRLAVELDSWRFHGGHWQFQRDRRKGLDLAERGFEVVRLTWFQVKHDPRTVARALTRILARREMNMGSLQAS